MATLQDFSRATGIRVVTRAQWGARAPRSRRKISLPTPRLWIHHSADERQGSSIRAHQDWHMDGRGWADIAYSLLVDTAGTVYEGRGIGVAGGHTAGDNSRSHGICVLGNHETRAPTAAAERTIVALARWGRDHGWWVPTLGGHRDAPGASTACPGRHLYARLQELRRQVNSGGAPKTPIKEWDEMATKKEIQDAVREVVRDEVRRAIAGRPPHVLAVREGHKSGDPVFLTDLASWKLEIQGKGPLHELHKALARLDGRSDMALRLAPEVLDAIPTIPAQAVDPAAVARELAALRPDGPDGAVVEAALRRVFADAASG